MLRNTYPIVQVTRAGMAAGLKNLADEYTKGTATEQEVNEILLRWKETSPNLIFDFKDGKGTQIASQITKIIGSRRTAVIQACYDALAGKSGL